MLALLNADTIDHWYWDDSQLHAAIRNMDNYYYDTRHIIRFVEAAQKAAERQAVAA